MKQNKVIKSTIYIDEKLNRELKQKARARGNSKTYYIVSILKNHLESGRKKIR